MMAPTGAFYHCVSRAFYAHFTKKYDFFSYDKISKRQIKRRDEKKNVSLKNCDKLDFMNGLSDI